MLTRFYQTSSLALQDLETPYRADGFQNKVVQRVMDAINSLIHEQHPEVQWSDAPKGV